MTNSDSLPPFATVFDSTAFVQAIRGISATGALLVSAATDTLGIPARLRPIETTLPEAATEAVVDSLRVYFRGGVASKNGMFMRVRVDLLEGSEPRLRMAGRQACEPVMRNYREIQRYLGDASTRAERPGRVVLWAFVQEDGSVQRARIQEGSGYEFLDAIAVGIATQMKFHPALLDREPIPVWVQVPFSFSGRR